VELDALADMLGNRLKKRSRHLAKWAHREGITCYRVYDRDIPEVPLAVDLYGDCALVSHFAREGQEREWLSRMEKAVSEGLGIASNRVFARVRERQRGKSQYQAQSAASDRRVVEEGGHKFWVDLTGYLDSGLFLDHRRTRALVAAEASGKRFLNLFCYTGSFTVYAARSGAVSSTSVDMSNRYTEWARDNLVLNEVLGEEHEVVQGDVMTYLLGARRSRAQFDLAIVDPPTFSNSKRMDKELDLLRDHGELLRDVSRVIAPRGVVFFSTNKRKFTLDEAGLARDYAEIADVTPRTVPNDFRHRPHRCWRLVRR